MKSYEDFALIYDQLMRDINYKEWFDYIQKLMSKYDIKPEKVLEMACGTGNLTEHLCRSGYDVTCFDLSEDMLSIAYDKLRSYKNLLILKQNMVDFQINNNYDAVISICDSINYITEPGDLLKVFNNVYSHLKEGGIFIFDINSYYKLSNIIGNNTFVEENDDVFYVWENCFNEEDNLCEFYLNFFIKEKELYRRSEEVHIERAYREEEILSALKEAKFKNIEIFDGLTLNKSHEESERINIISWK